MAETIMDRRSDDARVLVFAPGLDNAQVIAHRLTRAGFACLTCDDARQFEAHLQGDHKRLGAVVLTALAVRSGAGGAVSRFKASEPAWSALPIVLLTPPGAMTVSPWPHTTLLTKPTTAQQLVGVVERSLHAREHQQLMASASADLHRAAYFDTLTGLPNRSALYDRIRTLQRERRGAKSAFEAIFVDLNDFKRINDEFGHGAGDETLRLVAAHLLSTVRASDVVARWGGDEFMILLIGTVGAELVAETVGRLGQGMVLMLQGAEDPVMVSFSVGHVAGIAPDLSPDQILALADQRMYEHKDAKRRKGER
jgi:diguanylate cyclase (GGDEF)-like protein